MRRFLFSESKNAAPKHVICAVPLFENMLFLRAVARIIARARSLARIKQLRCADFTPGAQRPSRENPSKNDAPKRNVARKI